MSIAFYSNLNFKAHYISMLNDNTTFFIADNHEAFQDDTDQRKRNSHLLHLHGKIEFKQA